MQARKQSTTRPTPTRSTSSQLRRTRAEPRESAFSARYLERARRREAGSSGPGEALSDSPLPTTTPFAAWPPTPTPQPSSSRPSTRRP